MYSFFFFFNDTATTEIYTLSLHDALPIFAGPRPLRAGEEERPLHHLHRRDRRRRSRDRKSTRLNSSHLVISYAVFCLKKKKEHPTTYTSTGMIHSSPCHADYSFHERQTSY